MPWIVLAMDRLKFEQEFPQWRIELIKPIMVFRCSLSGGVSLRGLASGWRFDLCRGLKKTFYGWWNKLAIFADIVLRKTYEKH
jgi:hypothetical protein